MLNCLVTKSKHCLLGLICALFPLFSVAESYKAMPGVDGEIISVGSDTLAGLMTFWADGFKRYYPNVNIQIQASGSSTAPPALTEGTANIGPMSRALKPSEINYFVKKYGYEPKVLKVAIDAIAVFVNKQNQLKHLTLAQIDALFSVTRYCGSNNVLRRWGQLSNNLPSDAIIELYGRNSVSGTYGLFKQVALCNGDFKAQVNELPGSASVIQSIAYSKNAIGYAALGYETTNVRALPILGTEGSFVEPSRETIADGSYPLSRFLYLVVNQEPNHSLPKLQKEFIRYILSSEGQVIVDRGGYVPLSNELIEQQVISL